ncbi:sigma-70 family RNA polymerase sigma factor [Sphingomonas sp.]|uniref:sigma-70 family RNA polymerase sigma factor n=1 Tax=Sphingomonas sp. TaxID=28214 RepID=UPI003B00803D
MTYGRKPARERPADLVQAHMPLVRKIAWHVHGRVSNAIDIEDLVQIGMVALVEAAGGYEDRGHAFATYAGMRVRGAMIDHLRRHASQCRSGMAKRKEIARARAELEAKLGRAAGEAEMAQAMGLDAAGYRELADAAEAVRHESIDEVYSDQSMWFADLAEGADEALDHDNLKLALAAAIKQLPQREAMVLQLYFVEELNLEEIGRVLDIGAARVCQIKKAALDKVRVTLADLA